MPKDFVSQVYQDRSDVDSMRATLEQVLNDPGFQFLDPGTKQAVQSYFTDDTALPPHPRSSLILDLPKGWSGNTPNGPYEND